MAIPIPRVPRVELDGLPRHWANGNAVATAITNALNVLFPHGERFFVRSVNQYLDRLTDPVLREQVRAFFKQEGHHARVHDELNRVLRTQGLELDEFLARYQRIAVAIEKRVPAKLNLASTAAAEHFTAILADGAFSRGMLDAFDPRMQQLLAWHAAEEIEHKAVAFDVLREIDPSYLLRMAGLVYSTIMLGGFWLWGTLELLRQEGIGPRQALAELRKLRRGNGLIRGVFVAGIRQYIRRSFHPADNANERLARDWFARHGYPFQEVA
jgi:predicted metal-dependent hydrolase